MGRTKTLAALVGITALAGCVIEGPGPNTRPSTPPPQTGFEGTWGDTGGVATSTLTGGQFISTANDTGTRVAEGSYTRVNPTMIELNYTSLLRQVQVRANCILATTNQLNCTNDAGQQFSLIRRSAIS
ncbi:MAG: hypothetical protein WA921_02200 [Ahrensia sp.]